MNQIQHEQYTGKGGIYQQLTLPISENILIDEHEPAYTLPKATYDIDMYNRAFPVENALFFIAGATMEHLLEF